MSNADATDEVILRALKARYFDLASREDYPNKPHVTDELNKLTVEIRRRTDTQATPA